MNVLKKISNFFGQNMAIIVIAVAALALFAPGSVSFIKTSYVNTLLGIVMFGKMCIRDSFWPDPRFFHRALFL